MGGSYNRGDEGISEALIQTPDRQMRNFFRYHAQVERSYYKALAAADQIKRERRDRKPLKAIPATAQNGFVSQTRERTEPAPYQEPSTPAPAAVSDSGLPSSGPGLLSRDSGLLDSASGLAA
jgi:hypothetical protein